jgi:hypothetical protein
MSTNNFLYRREYDISDSIRIIIPTVGEILQDEDGYYNAVQFLTAQPIDFMVQLDDAGVDFTEINEWDLFLLLFPALSQMDTHLIFDNLDLSGFEMTRNEENGQIVLTSKTGDAKIDRAILAQIAATLRKIHHLEINRKKPANEEAKAYMLERARVKAKRSRKRKRDSDLESLIVAMVNTEQFKYDFGSTLHLSIYQFNESVRQIIKKIDYDNRMHGVYAGTINPKELSQDDLNWLVHK